MFSDCQLVPLWGRDLRTSGKGPPSPLTFLSVHLPRALGEINMPASSQEPMRCRLWNPPACYCLSPCESLLLTSEASGGLNYIQHLTKISPSSEMQMPVSSAWEMPPVAETPGHSSHHVPPKGGKDTALLQTLGTHSLDAFNFFNFKLNVNASHEKNWFVEIKYRTESVQY